MGKLRLRQLVGIHESTQLGSLLFLSLRLSHMASEHSKSKFFKVPGSVFGRLEPQAKTACGAGCLSLYFPTFPFLPLDKDLFQARD